MKQIIILALKKTVSSTVTGPADIFSTAGVLWNYILKKDSSPFFDVKIASIDGKPVSCYNNLIITPNLAIADVKHADLIIISSANLEYLNKAKKTVVPWLIKMKNQGTEIASVCSGAFLLAETGLLNNKNATTHWGIVEEFKKRYPLVNLKPECLLTDDSGLYSSGGAHAYTDLSLYLVEKYTNYEVAIECAKSLLLDYGRKDQHKYAIFEFQKKHSDKEILAVQEWIEKNYTKTSTVDLLAKKAGMSSRNFKRRFKNATGDTTISYLQRVRVEIAKRKFKSTKLSISEIANFVGYEDIAFFRNIFKKHTGLTPREYCNKI